MKKILLAIIVFILPINTLAYSDYIYRGGKTIGIEVNSNGIMIVGFYEVDGKVYVGELTFTPGLFLGFRPIEMDYKLGEYLDLSKYMNKETKAKKNKKDEKEKITN